MKLIYKILLGIIILFILVIIGFLISNKTVVPKEPTVTFKVINNAQSYIANYRISNSTINGWSPFKWKFLDRWYGRVIGANWLGNKFNEKTITISKDGSVYFYNPSWKYKFGGGLKINGKDIQMEVQFTLMQRWTSFLYQVVRYTLTILNT